MHGPHAEQFVRHKIVSMRLREDEWLMLSEMCLKSKQNVSEFLRESVLSGKQLAPAGRKREQVGVGSDTHLRRCASSCTSE